MGGIIWRLVLFALVHASPTLKQRVMSAAFAGFLQMHDSDKMPPGVTVESDISLLRLTQVVDATRTFEAQVAVHHRWNDSRVVGRPKNTPLDWIPPYLFVVTSLSPLIEKEYQISFNTLTGEVQSLQLFHLASTFEMTPRMYPWDTNVLSVKLYLETPPSLTQVGIGVEELQKEEYPDTPQDDWVITKIRRSAFAYCVPFSDTAIIFRVAKLPFVDRNQSFDAIMNECAQREPNVGLDLSLTIARKANIVRSVLPLTLIAGVANLQLYLDVRMVAARNQIVTLSLLNVFNFMEFDVLTVASEVTWFQMYGVVIILNMGIIVASGVYAHVMERKGRGQYANLLNRAFRIIAPFHFFVGVICVTMWGLYPTVAYYVWIIVYCTVMLVVTVITMQWFTYVQRKAKFLAEKVALEEQKAKREVEEKILLERHLARGGDFNDVRGKMKKHFSGYKSHRVKDGAFDDPLSQAKSNIQNNPKFVLDDAEEEDALMEQKKQ